MKKIFIPLFGLTAFFVNAQTSQIIYPTITNSNAGSSILAENTGTDILKFQNQNFQVSVQDATNPKIMAWDNGAGNFGTLTLPSAPNSSNVYVADDDPDVILTNDNGTLKAFVVKMGFQGSKIVIYIYSSVWNGSSFSAFDAGNIISDLTITANSFNPNIDYDGVNKFIVTWEQGFEIFVRTFQMTGSYPYYSASQVYCISTSTPVVNYLSTSPSTYVANNCLKPDICMNNSGNFFMAFRYGLNTQNILHTAFVYKSNINSVLSGTVIPLDLFCMGTAQNPVNWDYEPKVCCPSNTSLPNTFGVLWRTVNCRKLWPYPTSSPGALAAASYVEGSWYGFPAIQDFLALPPVYGYYLNAEYNGNDNHGIAVSDNYFQVVWEHVDVNGLIGSTPYFHLLSRKFDYTGNRVPLYDFSLVSSVQTASNMKPSIAGKKISPSDKFGFAFNSINSYSLGYKLTNESSIPLFTEHGIPENKENLLDPDLVSRFGVAYAMEQKILKNKKVFKPKEIEPGNSLLIYPNPTNGQFNLQLPKDMPYMNAKGSVYNSRNELVRSFTIISSNLVLNFKDLQNGIYMLKVSNSEHQYQAKVIINH